IAGRVGGEREGGGEPDAAEEPLRLLALPGGLEQLGEAEARAGALPVLRVAVEEAAVESHRGSGVAGPRRPARGEPRRPGRPRPVSSTAWAATAAAPRSPMRDSESAWR